MQQFVGSVMIDLLGSSVDAEERELLQHPLVGGVILFARNYESIVQINELCQVIRSTHPSSILIAVDQEGGRVQRFRDGFTRLPCMGEIGHAYERSVAEGIEYAYSCGWIMAAELLAVGVDLSFSPVLDLNKKWNTVIGDRSFSQDPHVVSVLAKALTRGMCEAGMAATGKHFPGHGSVKTDSHLTLPIDSRPFTEVYEEDMQPFIQMIAEEIDALMPAHILFSEIDSHPVGFSRYWLQDILRKKLQFSGIIFSDDLNMAGAEFAGTYAARAEMALNAGCDMALICNNRAGAIEILDQLPRKHKMPVDKWHRLKGKFSHTAESLFLSKAWKTHSNSLAHYRKLYETHQ